MNISCPKCHQQYEVDVSLIGEKVECLCGHKWVVEDERTKKSKINILGLIVRAIIFALGCLVIYNGAVGDSPVKGLIILGGIIILPFAFVSLKPKIKRFYFICPNPNCKFEGELEYNPEKGILGNALYIMLMQAAGYRTILIDNPTVTCPRCGMRTPHSMR